MSIPNDFTGVEIKSVGTALLNETSVNSLVHVYQDLMFIAGTGSNISEGESRQKR